MIVVKTISQLEEAIRERDPDVMVVGTLVNTIMKTTPVQTASSNENIISAEQDGIVNSLQKNFSVSAIHYRNENAIGAIHQQPESKREMPW